MSANNVMQVAMQRAGLAVPSQGKRVWLWLKDHPDKPSRDIATALSLTQAAVSSLLTDMIARGMVSFIVDPVRRVGRGPKTVNRYRVIGSEYELKPRKHRKGQAPAQPTKPSSTVKLPAPTPCNDQKASKEDPNDPLDFLEHKTLAELRVIHKHLSKFFGNK